MADHSDHIIRVAYDVGAVALRSAPGAAATAITWGQGISLLVGLLTALFLILQIAHLLWKWRRDARLEAVTS